MAPTCGYRHVAPTEQGVIVDISLIKRSPLSTRHYCRPASFAASYLGPSLCLVPCLLAGRLVPFLRLSALSYQPDLRAMKKVFRKVIFGVLLISSSILATAQQFDSLLLKLDTELPQEKLYLHFDKSAYNPGETIWFKAYLFTANFPSEISKTIYAELVDEQGKVLQKKSAPVFRYGAAAAFDLPADLNSSVVYVRAYTRWMLNFDSSFIFVRGLPVNSFNKKQSPKPVTQPMSSLQFFPEGGDLVEGVESRVAFKGIDQSGFPILFSGDLFDKQGKRILAFKPAHDGMGVFNLKPEPGQEYLAKWKDRRGQSYETKLPVARKDAVVLQVDVLPTGMRFTVKRANEIPIESPLQLVVQMQQQLLYKAKVNISAKPEVSGTLPTDNLVSGIVQLTLFSNEGQPMAERIVFVNRQDYYFITDLNPVIKNLGKRSKNIIRIDVPDTIVTNLSVSVTDADLNPPIKHESDIFSSVLLSSDIKGYVHNPGYYFSSEADSVAAHLDLVMMTNGWRRFRWDEVLANRWRQIRFKPDNYLAIKGQVRGINKNEYKDRDVTAILVPKGGGKQFVNIPLSADGSFELPDVLYYDTLKLYYQLTNDKNKVLTTRANFDFSNNLMRENVAARIPEGQESYILRPDSISLQKSKQAAEKNLEQQRKVQTLASVEVIAKQKTRKQKIEEEYTSGFFTGDGNSFVPDDDPSSLGALNVFQYLQGKVAGLQIFQSGGTVSLTWRGGPPILFLDEMQQQDASLLQTMPMSNVALVKVFRPPFFGGFGGGNGAIAVYTKKGNFMAQDVKGLDYASISGYSPVKEFYSPDYEADPAADKDDYRTTLYWNPYVLTEKNNRKILLTFFNNDITRRMRVVIEGMNAEGRLTRIEKIFE